MRKWEQREGYMIERTDEDEDFPFLSKFVIWAILLGSCGYLWYGIIKYLVKEVSNAKVLW